ncbi:DUF1653 domain-containing protein [Phenylobacterium sp.]|uniref:DUF1653 domain-containing protein n=1 Tax=Phenylobacterium sp. TaxID=1871053 RepID=UPI002F414C24
MNLYRHLKTGRIYAVLHAHAELESDRSVVVIYQGVDEETIWVRPASEFHDGRFAKLRPSDLAFP